MIKTSQRLKMHLSIENTVSILAEITILLVLFVAGYAFVTSRFIKSKSTTGTTEISSQSVEIDREMTAIGYKDGINGDEMFVIPENDRQNIGIFGEIGSGKTSVLRLLIMQDIMRGTGFLLIDPHREFSREVLSMIPKDMQDKVVYISLASLYQFGRTVCINPLETQTEHEKYIRTAGCIDNLKQYFSDGWGHRLETVLRNMINLVMSTPDTFKFLDIIGVLYDENKRAAALKKSNAPAVRDFWTSVFPKYSSEAAGAIYNKFDKIINTPPIAAIFSSQKSTINIKDIIENGKIVIVDLGSAATADIIEFMGTMLINMFNLENKIRFDIEDSAKAPFNIYIDEVHMFSAPVIRELLNNVRKYNMKVTVATQSVKVLDDKLAKELDDLFRCMVMFRCDFDTARLLARNLPLEEDELAHLGFHRFAAFSQGVQRVSGVGKTRHIEIKSRWKEVAEKSLKKYGKIVPLNTVSSFDGKGSILPKLSPLEYFLLNTLYLEGRDVNEGELVAAAKAKFNVIEGTVNRALDDSLITHHKYVIRNTDYHDGRKQFSTKSFVSISSKGISEIYSRAYSGPGAGGDLHRAVISAVAHHNIAYYHYCIVDLADTYGPRADLMIYSFKPKIGTADLGKYDTIHPDHWSSDVIAVEVETDPTRHKDQVFRNYEKNISRGMRVSFVIFNEKHKQCVLDLMAKNNIGKESYEIVILNPKDVDYGNKIYHGESLTYSESRIADAIGTDYQTLFDIVNKVQLTPSQVFIALEGMEKKGIIERSGVLKTRHIQQVDGTGMVKTGIKKDIFRINPDVLKPEKLEPEKSEHLQSQDGFNYPSTVGTDPVTGKLLDKKSDELVDEKPDELVDKKPDELVDKEKSEKPDELLNKEKSEKPDELLDKEKPEKPEKLVDKEKSEKPDKSLDKEKPEKPEKIKDESKIIPESKITSRVKTQESDEVIDVTPQGKYHNTDNSALALLLEDKGHSDYEEMRSVLKLRGFGVRRKRNGGVTLYRLR